MPVMFRDLYFPHYFIRHFRWISFTCRVSFRISFDFGKVLALDIFEKVSRKSGDILNRDFFPQDAKWRDFLKKNRHKIIVIQYFSMFFFWNSSIFN